MQLLLKKVHLRELVKSLLQKKKPAEDVEMKDEEKEVKAALTVPELPKKGPPTSFG